MQRFKNTHEAETIVIFHDEVKAKEYFIDSEWAKSFTQYEDLFELTKDLADCFMAATEHWNAPLQTFTRWIEAYGTFAYNQNSGNYDLTELGSEYGGPISIRIEDTLEVYYTELLPNED